MFFFLLRARFAGFICWRNSTKENVAAGNDSTVTTDVEGSLRVKPYIPGIYSPATRVMAKRTYFYPSSMIPSLRSGHKNFEFTGQSFTLYSEIFPAARPDSSCLRNGTSSSQFPGSYPRSSEEERRFPFASTRTLESSVCYPLTPTIAANSQGEMNERMFQGGLAQVLDSGLALSLLSSSSRSVGINFRNAATAGGVSQSQPTFSSFHEHCPPQYPYPQSSSQISSTGFSYSGLVDEQAGGLLLTEAVDPDLHC